MAAPSPLSPRLYEQLAARVREQILSRTFRPGDRLPSVRELSRQSRVSVSTVLDAYRLLEDEGLVHPRPQSGYYVRSHPRQRPAEPMKTEPARVASSFSRDDLLQTMTHAKERSDVQQLAIASPNPDLLPHARLAQLIGSVAREHPEASYGYGPASGHRALREQIAQRAFLAGASVSPDEIVITNGCQEALCLSLRAICKPGDVVLVESPCHYGILQAIQMAGLRSLEVCTRSREGICLDAVEEAIEHGRRTGNPVKAILVNSNFQNPLGALTPDREKARLVTIARTHGIPIVEDDVYGDLGFEEERPRVVRAFDEDREVLLCSSFSKTIAPGYRVGWVAAGKRHASIERLKYAASVAAPSLPQLVVAQFLSNGGYDKYLRRARRAYAQSVREMSDAVGRFFPAGTRLTRPEGGFVLWGELPERVDTTLLYQAALAERILIAPGVLFSTQDTYRNCFRLTASRWTPETEAAIARLGRLASARLV